MEVGPEDNNMNGLLGPSSILVVYMDPLGKLRDIGVVGTLHRVTSTDCRWKLLVLTRFLKPKRFRGLGFRGNASTEPLWDLVLSSGFF